MFSNIPIVTYKHDNLKEDNIKIIFDEKTYATILAAVNSTKMEITYLAKVDKECRNGNYYYTITNALFPPQWNEAMESKTIDSQYAKWIYNVEKENDHKVVLNGHSHPSFAVTPSGYDITFYNTLKQQCNLYTVRMIINQKGLVHLDLYDKDEMFEVNEATCYIITKNESVIKINSKSFDVLLSKKETIYVDRNNFEAYINTDYLTITKDTIFSKIKSDFKETRKSQTDEGWSKENWTGKLSELYPSKYCEEW
jgi:proteasome lid subunit RPN8/RPN11